MERGTIIKISRKGPSGSWHNNHIGLQFVGCVAETDESIKLNINGEGALWVDKKYIDIRQSVNDPWVQYGFHENTVKFVSAEQQTLANNPLLKDMAQTFERCLFTAVAKNNDYGGTNNDPFANFRNSTIAGVTVEKGILVRLMDKMSRVSTLLDKEAMVKDEAITDTIEDAINYLAIMKAYINLKNKKPC